MSSSSVTTSDGTVIIARDDDDAPAAAAVPVLHQHRGMIHLGPDGAYVHSGKPFDPGSFCFGLTVGVLLLWLFQLVRRNRVRTRQRLAAIGPQADTRDHDRMMADVAALARRTATLETIVTDPAHRTAREIDALR